MKRIILSLLVASLLLLAAPTARAVETDAPPVVLILGNSISFTNGFGLAASDAEHGWRTIVEKRIVEEMPDAEFRRLRCSGWEQRCSSNREKWLDENLDPLLSPDIALVLIQLGDNSGEESHVKTLEDDSVALIARIRAAAPNARFCWIGCWYYTSGRQEAVAAAAERAGNCLFVAINDLKKPENYSKIGAKVTLEDGSVVVLETKGQASHPNDDAMAEIAARVIETLYPTGGEEEKLEANE